MTSRAPTMRPLALAAVALALAACRSPLEMLERGPVRVADPAAITNEMRASLPGRVDVVFVVQPDGRASDARVTASTDPVFDDAALDLVGAWRFEPATSDGRRVATHAGVTILFADE